MRVSWYVGPCTVSIDNFMDTAFTSYVAAQLVITFSASMSNYKSDVVSFGPCNELIRGTPMNFNNVSY